MITGVGKRIKQLRSFLNLTQEQFALPLGIDRGHVAGIETGSRNPSEPLLRLIHLIYCVNETWLRTGEGTMFISPEEVIKSQMARLGEGAIIEAFNNIMKERGLTGTAGQPVNREASLTDLLAQTRRAYDKDPVLKRMIDALYTIWTAGDEKLKNWAEIQFDSSFPAKMVEEAQKKHTESYKRLSAGEVS
jgi:transcriptional regulator with XRE-family HTH domain